MKTSTPVRIDAELYASATDAASVMSRSTSQQVAHWARIGRELEASSGVSVEQVARVLGGAVSYDDLNSREQAVTRSFWAEKMAAMTSSLDLERRFAGEGRAFVELDENGQVVRREAPDSE